MSVKSKIAAIAVVGGLLAGAPASVSEASAATSPTVEATICGEAGGAIARLYRAYFNRVPDQPGLEYWGGIFQGKDLPTVAYWMAQSEEYQAAW